MRISDWSSDVCSSDLEVYGRLKAADRPVVEEGATTCCYAKSEKSWIADPQGVVWEAFYTSGDATDYGNSPKLSALSGNAADDACCGQAMPTAKLGCCGRHRHRFANPPDGPVADRKSADEGKGGAVRVKH